MNVKYIKTTDNKKYDLRDKRITDTDTGIATQSANGLLSSTDKKKLDSIASGAEVNQNAFSNIKIGNTTIVADGKTDTVELTAGNNITLTPDATNDRITIAATNTNTTYTFKGGTNQFTVTPSNGTAQTVSVTPSIANNVTGSDLTANTIILGNGNSGVKKSGKTIVTTLGSDDTTLPTSKAVKAAIDALPEPMIFKGTLGKDGTITSLPTAAASNEGYTYKVITDGKYAQQSAKAGDVFISNGSSWNLIPSGDEPSGTVTNVATGTGLTGGPITSSGTISHADTSSQASVSNSGRTYIQSITLDGMGHVTGIASATETVTNTDIHVTQHRYSGDGIMPLLFATEQSGYPGDITNIVYRNDSICARPSDGYIFAKRFIGSFEGTLYGSAHVAHQLETSTSVGSETQPVYFSEGVPTAISYTINKSVPSNAVFTDTHYTTHLYAGSGTAANAATTNGNTKLTVVDNTTTRNSVTIKGTGGTTVMSDANGIVTIDSTDTFCKQFTFKTPIRSDDGFYFIISPIGEFTSTPDGTCYSVEITALINNGPSSYVTRSAKFMTHCYWSDQNYGLRITDPVYNSGYISNCPILYRNQAVGTDVGTETRYFNVCNIPFKLPIETGLMSINIKVQGPGVSMCKCSQSMTSFKWSTVEPDWSAI